MLRLISFNQNSATTKVIIKDVMWKTDRNTLELGLGRYSKSVHANFYRFSNAKCKNNY